MRAVSSIAILLSTATGCGGDAPPDDAPAGPPSAAELLARIATCDPVIGGPFAPSNAKPADIQICGFPGAVAWQADMSIDCDGKMSDKCSLQTDPAYQNQTAASDSNGDPLDAATLPYVVIPGKSTLFDYAAAGLGMGSVVAVIYDGKVEYGVLGDVGPKDLIGEASYRMAELLGIDPDPRVGGIDSGVAYVAFTGSEAKVQPIEDHDAAVALGIAHAETLLAAP